MSDGKTKSGGSGASEGSGAVESRDVATLQNSLRFEREKNEVLLNEVVALEDELVNRQLKDFDGVVSEESAPFWREQLLSNREAATVALEELRQARQASASGVDVSTRRPLHNRERSRPLPRRGLVGEGGASAVDEDSKAVRIRNRAQELSKAERIPFSSAFRLAEQEICGEGSR